MPYYIICRQWKPVSSIETMSFLLWQSLPAIVSHTSNGERDCCPMFRQQSDNCSLSRWISSLQRPRRSLLNKLKRVSQRKQHVIADLQEELTHIGIVGILTPDCTCIFTWQLPEVCIQCYKADQQSYFFVCLQTPILQGAADKHGYLLYKALQNSKNFF